MGLVLQKDSSPGGLEPPTFRLTAERANRLRHGDMLRKKLKIRDMFSSSNLTTVFSAVINIGNK